VHAAAGGAGRQLAKAVVPGDNDGTIAERDGAEIGTGGDGPLAGFAKIMAAFTLLSATEAVCRFGRKNCCRSRSPCRPRSWPAKGVTGGDAADADDAEHPARARRDPSVYRRQLPVSVPAVRPHRCHRLLAKSAWPAPAARAVTPDRVGTLMGTRWAVVVPSPNWPIEMLPQA